MSAANRNPESPRGARRPRGAGAFIAFFAVILGLTGLSWLIVGSFIHDLIPGGWRTWAIAWAVSVAPLFILIYNVVTRCYPSAWLRVFVFRPFWYSQLLMLPLALISGALSLPMVLFGLGEETGRAVVLGLGAGMILLGMWGYVGSRRLVQLSDLHVGPHTPRSHLARIAHATTEAQPHIIAYTGDQVDDYPHDVDDLGEAFGQLRAPLGTYAIAGNHDVYAGWADVRKGLEALGMRTLVNEALKLTHRGVEFWLAGTGDPAGLQVPGSESAGPDVARTLSAVPPGAFTVVLAHNPALFKYLAPRGVGVVLSGHTHHGQFSIPSRNWSLASVFLEYAMGTYERNGSILYVSPGANYWGIPFRIGSLPEVSVVTLRAAAA